MANNSEAYKKGYSYGEWIGMYETIHCPYKEGTQEWTDWQSGVNHAIEDRLS